jgi:hypothetical protein
LATFPSLLVYPIPLDSMMQSLPSVIKNFTQSVWQPIDVRFVPLTCGRVSSHPLVSPAAAPQRGRAEIVGCFDAPPHDLDPRWIPIVLPQFLDALLARHSLARTFPGSCVRTRSLSPDRQSLAVPKAPVTSDITQPSNALLDLPTELTFDSEVVVQERRQLGKLVFGEVTGLLARVYSRTLAKNLGQVWTDAVDVLQGKKRALVVGDVNTQNSRHPNDLRSSLVLATQPAGMVIQDRHTSALPLLVTRVRANHIHFTRAAHNLAVLADPLYARSNFHVASIQIE